MDEFCEEHHIRLDLASVAHPKSNGQAERANQSILDGLKPRLQVPLERTAGCWVEELPSVIWGIRTSVNRSTGFTPFFMVYGAKAFMPTDLERTRTSGQSRSTRRGTRPSSLSHCHLPARTPPLP